MLSLRDYGIYAYHKLKKTICQNAFKRVSYSEEILEDLENPDF